MIQSKWRLDKLKMTPLRFVCCKMNKIHQVVLEKSDKVLKLGQIWAQIGQFDPLRTLQSKWHLDKLNTIP